MILIKNLIEILTITIINIKVRCIYSNIYTNINIHITGYCMILIKNLIEIFNWAIERVNMYLKMVSYNNNNNNNNKHQGTLYIL